MKKCDHTSVGIIVKKDDKMLMIKRARFPFGLALPAGHVDDDVTFEAAAQRELKEEVGLNAVSLKKVAEFRMENPCRREDGTWHLWKLFEADTTGTLMPEEKEVSGTYWFFGDDIKRHALRTEKYRIKEITDEEWKESPGLEPVMYDLFKMLKII